MGILTEHFTGAFPLWLAPVHAKLLPVSENYIETANEIQDALLKAGLRVEVDTRNEKLGYKIREAQLEKVPYMFVIGENEKTTGTVAVRKRGEGDLGSLSIADIVEKISTEIREKQ